MATESSVKTGMVGDSSVEYISVSFEGLDNRAQDRRVADNYPAVGCSDDSELEGVDLRPASLPVSIVAVTPEQQELLQVFLTMLAQTSKDGGRKRAAGIKPSWKIDTSHEAAIFSHLNKWKHGERVDSDSGMHPLVHMAWRALAIAWQETHDNATA